MDIETIRRQWSKTYNTRGKPDWSHLFPYYHQNIIFQDSIQRVEGKKAFMALCKRLSDRCKELKMEIVDLSQTENRIFMQWEMTMMFKKFPSSTLYGCSKLTLNEESMIIEQRDYYDLWGDIFDNIPRFGRMYRKFMHRKFG
ncbi:MAG: nuclear transport factor 2 family protein [Spirochaetaceae bacterium]|nr:nuclear transport factor 2 family protein [Spirochaetaceae bacterium]MCF7949983.1 nuclear transport factor 2 family protein [Spirochaetia bacterium]MCF7951086.1 nuclear transport factor 2 family protein [Spirochaetaceae bacterium]